MNQSPTYTPNSFSWKQMSFSRKGVLGSEMSRYPGRLLPWFAQGIKQFFVIIRYKECQKNKRNISLRWADYFHVKTDF